MSIVRIEIIETSRNNKKRKNNVIKNCPTKIPIKKRIKLANNLFYHKTYCSCGVEIKRTYNYQF